MSLFDKLKKATQPPRKKENHDSESKNNGESQVSEADLHKALKQFLYSDDLVNEMLPVFRKLSKEKDLYEPLLELIQAKEKELNNINQSKDYFNQDSDDNQASETTEGKDDEGNDPNKYLLETINNKYPNQ